MPVPSDALSAMGLIVVQGTEPATTGRGLKASNPGVLGASRCLKTPPAASWRDFILPLSPRSGFGGGLASWFDRSRGLRSVAASVLPREPAIDRQQTVTQTEGGIVVDGLSAGIDRLGTRPDITRVGERQSPAKPDDRVSVVLVSPVESSLGVQDLRFCPAWMVRFPGLAVLQHRQAQFRVALVAALRR